MRTICFWRPAVLFAALGIAALGTVSADQKPLWEFGLGVGTIVFQDYRGADTTHAYVLPLPYFYYRGKFLQADRDGVRGRLFNQDWIELNVSLDATTPVRRNAARAGMPDLRPTFEIGPSLDLHLWKSASQKMKFDVRLPLRSAFTFQAPPRAIGWVFTPNASVDIADVAGLPGWNFGALAGPLFANRHYNNYLYTVDPQYATAQRPAFQAAGGYAGTQVLASLSKRYPAYWVGAYVRHDSLAGAVFESSPLVKRNSYWAGGLGFAWIIHQSAGMVEAAE
ncbi:MAG TPA: MipA/OmpV family protein [Steroidobacteraceae bacterium]|jgi:outer membrane scaffolding protein for murein synthesis (MipA/OmpV family)